MPPDLLAGARAQALAEDAALRERLGLSLRPVAAPGLRVAAAVVALLVAVTPSCDPRRRRRSAAPARRRWCR